MKLRFEYFPILVACLSGSAAAADTTSPLAAPTRATASQGAGAPAKNGAAATSKAAPNSSLRADAVRWRGGIPSDVLSAGLDFLQLDGCSLDVHDGAAWFTPSLPLSTIMFQDWNQTPVRFDLPSPLASAGPYDLTLDQLSFRSASDGQRLIDVTVNGDTLQLHASLSARILAHNFLLPDGYIYLDNVDISVGLWTLPETATFDMKSVNVSTSYHLDFGAGITDDLMGSILSFINQDIPITVDQIVTRTVEAKFREANLQNGIVDAITRLENNVSDWAQIPLPRVNVYPGTIHLSNGNLCIRGYVCDDSGFCPQDDNQALNCSDLAREKDALYDDWTHACDGDIDQKFCQREAKKAGDAYERALETWRACIMPSCDPWNPSTY